MTNIDLVSPPKNIKCPPPTPPPGCQEIKLTDAELAFNAFVDRGRRDLEEAAKYIAEFEVFVHGLESCFSVKCVPEEQLRRTFATMILTGPCTVVKVQQALALCARLQGYYHLWSLDYFGLCAKGIFQGELKPPSHGIMMAWRTIIRHDLCARAGKYAYTLQCKLASLSRLAQDAGLIVAAQDEPTIPGGS